jgi:phosphatidylinositol alpha-mannosyltransferase
MKVGFISFHSFSNPGGVKSHILGLSKEFEKRGIETRIIVPRRKLIESYGKNIIIMGTSVPFNVAGTQGDLCFNLNPLAIRRILKREKFDILHFHNFVVPLAWQILDRSDCTNVMTFHANVEAMPIMERKRINDLFVKNLNKKMDGIIGVASFNLDLFDNFKGKKAVIPNGIDLDQFKPDIPKLAKFDDGRINILFLGRIEERKGLIYLLMAYKLLQEKHSNLRLIIVGDGPLEGECKKYAKDNGLKEVCWEGRKTGSAAAQYYATCDIYCSPAIFGESFGIVLLEAMACGKPVAGFANSGYKELLKGTKGEEFLAEPKNYAELTKKLEKLIDDADLRKKMGKWGLEEVQKYSWKNVADRVLEFYKQCSNKH